MTWVYTTWYIPLAFTVGDLVLSSCVLMRNTEVDLLSFSVLAHLMQRVMYAIVITLRPLSVRLFRGYISHFDGETTGASASGLKLESTPEIGIHRLRLVSQITVRFKGILKSASFPERKLAYAFTL